MRILLLCSATVLALCMATGEKGGSDVIKRKFHYFPNNNNNNNNENYANGIYDDNYVNDEKISEPEPEVSEERDSGRKLSKNTKYAGDVLMNSRGRLVKKGCKFGTAQFGCETMKAIIDRENYDRVNNKFYGAGKKRKRAAELN